MLAKSIPWLLIIMLCISFGRSGVESGDMSFNVPIVGESPACSPKLCTEWSCESGHFGRTYRETCDIIQCVKWNNDVCEQYNCTEYDSIEEKKSCAEYKCLSFGNTYCDAWDCDLYEMPKKNNVGKDYDTCTTWFCSQRDESGVCKNWWCNGIGGLKSSWGNACSAWKCAEKKGNSCNKWDCVLDGNYNVCSHWLCAANDPTTCTLWNCTETNVPINSKNTCGSWSCTNWKEIEQGNGCSCAHSDECASGCCAQGICSEGAGEADQDQSVCVCKNHIWQDNKCCGDDPGESWCGSSGMCQDGSWVSVDDADSHKEFCSQCLGKTWIENKCCGDDADDNYCGSEFHCLAGEKKDLCSSCERCSLGQCSLDCNLEGCQDVDSRCIEESSGSDSPDKIENKEDTQEVPTETNNNVDSTKEEITKDDGDYSGENCNKKDGTWIGSACCGDDPGEQWSTEKGVCTNGVFIENGCLTNIDCSKYVQKTCSKGICTNHKCVVSTDCTVCGGIDALSCKIMQYQQIIIAIIILELLVAAFVYREKIKEVLIKSDNSYDNEEEED